MIQLELHPDAAKNFNAKAEALLPLIKGITSTDVASFRPDLYVAARITEAQMATPLRQVAITDMFGNETGRFFGHHGQRYGLLADDHKVFLSVVPGMQRTKAFVDRVSIRRLRGLVFEWLGARGEVEAKQRHGDDRVCSASHF